MMETQAQIVRSLMEQLQKPLAQCGDEINGISAEFDKIVKLTFEEETSSVKNLQIIERFGHNLQTLSPKGGPPERLRSQSIKYRTDKTFSCKTAEKQVNIKKNRYKDIIPFEHSRVKLTFSTSESDSDYINANFIKGVSGPRDYIATQGPLPHTVGDFLRMLWEYHITVVVMACREFEMGKKKCEIYWSRSPDTPFVCKPFTVGFVSEEDKGDYLTRTLTLTYNNSSRPLKQLHYVNWPDHGVPDSIPPILEMLHEMRSYQSNSPQSPNCIHCSAGCGRTGVLCVIDYTWNLLDKQMIPVDFSIFDLVQNMRTQRPSVVQTREQYDLIYRTISFMFQRFLQNQHQTRPNEAHGPLVPGPTTVENQFPDLSEDNPSRLHPQHLLQEEEETTQFHSLYPGIPAVTPAWIHPHQQPRPLWTHPEDTNQETDGSLKPVQAYQFHPADQIKTEAVETPPPPLAAGGGIPVIYLMVEDPYFNSPLNPSEPEEHQQDGGQNQPTKPLSLPSVPTVEKEEEEGEEPPPLPRRTPDSFILAVDGGIDKPQQRLTLHIPPCAADGAPAKSTDTLPPSPVPPLPERTPESFELSSDQGIKVTPAAAVKFNGIGLSSNWPSDAPPVEEPSGCGRSQSLKSNVTFTDEENQTPPLPERTPEFFLFSTQHEPEKACSSRVGTSFEWDGPSRPKDLLVLDGTMSRSKSVRAQSSRREPFDPIQPLDGVQPLAAVQPLAPFPVMVAGAGRVENHRFSLNLDTPDPMKKSMNRTKSLKFFKAKPKNQPPVPPPSNQPQCYGASLSVFNLGFKNRFLKPKGPRDYPTHWF